MKPDGRWRGALGAGLALAAFAGGLAAHTTATGLATIDAGSDSPTWRLTINPGELGASAADITRAAQGDSAAAQRVAQWLAQDVAIAVDDQPCRIRRTRFQASPLGDDRIAIGLDFACPAAPGTLTLTDRLSRPFGEHYRTIASVRRADGAHEERLFDRDHESARFAFGQAAPVGWLGFGRMGIAHILSGLDHLLFLAALLIGASGLRALLGTVTAFTLAHSAALALAVLGWVTLAPAIVEPLIAASIVWVAGENLWPRRAGGWRRHGLAFGFGLVHGLAFSEALRELQLTGWSLARALLGFNLGVEAGQALVVVVLAPLLAWASRRPKARRWQRPASVLIGATGLFWLAQRLMVPGLR